MRPASALSNSLDIHEGRSQRPREDACLPLTSRIKQGRHMIWQSRNPSACVQKLAATQITNGCNFHSTERHGTTKPGTLNRWLQ